MDDVYVRKVQEGDTAAFRYFLKEYKDMAFSIALSVVKDEFTAEEVVQDAFLKAFNGLAKFRFEAKFSTWFYRIVTNQALLKLRSIRRDIIDYNPVYENDIEDISFIERLVEEERVNLVNEALSRLSPKESLVLRLFYLDEERIKTVCEITGWTESNVKVILHRARKNMLSVIRELMNVNLQNHEGKR